MSLFDFDKLKRPESGRKLTNPIEIFRASPTLPETPNDLWQGQSKALEEWDAHRNENDLLISLHTGAGKCLVGLLICQSLINEGVSKVVYVCATNDLVTQTSREVDRKLGFEYTIRARQQWSNDLYDIGKSFCITNYQALFNSKSSFSGDRRPQAIIFDDAHVAEKIIRDSYTLTVNRKKESDLFQRICGLLRPHFEAVDRREYFENVLRGDSSYRVIQSPPSAIVALKRDLTDLFLETGFARRELYVMGHLTDQLAKCSIFVSQNNIEICPSFIPSRRIPILSDPGVRRIYLSATLTSAVDFCRAFGRRPSRRIEPESDAGTGERLIVLANRERLKSNGQVGVADLSIAASLASKHKVLITTMSYAAAEKYKPLALPPSADDFTRRLDAFKEAESGVFVLVARVDGIDLPHGTCRVTLADGLPTGFSLYEQYLFDFLEMRNSFAAKIANRITQLFGRTNRGRNDYSVIFVSDRKFTTWLQAARNLALLPELLRKQVLLGSSLIRQFGIDAVEQLSPLATQVIQRDPAWLRYYTGSITGMDVAEEDQARSAENDELMTRAAVAEAEFAAKLWDGDYPGAREALGAISDEVVKVDRKLAGWYNIQIGHSYELDGDHEAAAKQYSVARSRLLSMLALPIPEQRESAARGQRVVNEVHERLLYIFDNDIRIQNDRIAKYHYAIKKLEDEEASSNEHEEAVRSFGELLGFEATRPEQDFGTGPDVLWRSNVTRQAISFELKTKKKADGCLGRTDIGQGHDHIQWIKENCSAFDHLGLIYVSDVGSCTKESNPATEMWLTTRDSILSQYSVYHSWLMAVQRMRPLDRFGEISEAATRQDWSVKTVFYKIRGKSLQEMTR